MPAQPAFVGSGAASGANTPLSPQPPPPVVLPPLPHIPQPLQPAQVTQPGYAQSAHQSAYAVMGDIPPRSVSGSARTVPLDGTEVVRTNSNSQATQTPHMKKLHGLNPKVLADGTLDTLREKLVSALKEGNLTDVEFVVGNSKDKVKAHSLILRLLSPSLGALLPPAPLKPPVTIPLPDLEGAAVKAYLVHLYSGDPDDLVEGIGAGTGWKPAIDRLKAVLTLSGVSNEGQGALLSELELRLKETLDSTLGPADDGLPSIPETEEDDNDDDVSEIDVKPSPAKPPSEFSKALTALRSLDPPQGLLASPLLVSALSQRPPLTPAQLGRLTAGLDFDVARQGTSLEWPGGEIQKFHWIRGWIDSNGIARKSPEAKELAGSIRLDRISLDDLETIVEPSGIIPLRLIVRQYTVMARRLRATSNIPLSRSAQIAAAQQQQALQQAQSPIAMAPVMQPPGVVQGMAGVLGNGVGEARIKQEAEMRARQEEQRRFEEQRRAQEERARQEAAKAQAEANARAQEAEQRRQEELRRQQDETRARMEAEGKAKAQAEAAARAQAEAQAKAQAEAQARAQAEAAQRAQAEATARAQAEAAARAQADAASAAALLKRQQEEQARAQAQLAELEAQRQALLRQEQELAARATPTVSQLATPAASRDVLPMRAESPLVKPVFGQQSPTPNSSNPSSPPKPQPQQAASMPQPSMTSPAAVASSSAVPPSPAHALSPLAAAGVPPGSPQQPAGFDSWVAIPDDISVQQDVILFRNPEVASTCRMKNPLTSGKWRWVLLVEKTASIVPPPPTQSPSLSPTKVANPSPLYFPDIGLVIGDADRFDPSQPLRTQLSTVSWDGRELVNVNAKPIPYNRAKGGYFKEGDIVVLDLNLDGPQTSLGFRKNGVDCGTAVRGFPAKVYLAMCAKAPVQIRWLALAQM